MRRIGAMVCELAGIGLIAASLWELAPWVAGLWVGLWMFAAALALEGAET